MNISKRFFIYGTAFSFALWSSGCASVFSTNTYTVEINSTHKNLDFSVMRTSDDSIVAEGKTPQKVSLKTYVGGDVDMELYYVTFLDSESKIHRKGIKSTVDPWFFGNLGLLLVGIFPGCIGVITDASTGAARKLPEQVLLTSFEGEDN